MAPLLRTGMTHCQGGAHLPRPSTRLAAGSRVLEQSMDGCRRQRSEVVGRGEFGRQLVGCLLACAGAKHARAKDAREMVTPAPLALGRGQGRWPLPLQRQPMVPILVSMAHEEHAGAGRCRRCCALALRRAMVARDRTVLVFLLAVRTLSSAMHCTLRLRSRCSCWELGHVQQSSANASAR